MASGVQSVTRALRILEAVAQSISGVGVRELARIAELKVPTAHGLIKTLAAEGYLSQDENTEKYCLGHKCFALAGACSRSRTLPGVAVPPMERLASDTGETVFLAMMRGRDIVWAAHAMGTRELVANLGDYPPPDPYETVTGRTLLAFASPERLAEFVRAYPIAESTGEQIRTRADLDEELLAIRTRGYSMIRRRQADSLSAVAAPVRNHAGAVIAAVGLSLPSSRFRKPHLTTVQEGVCATARGVSMELGWQEQLAKGEEDA
jgi:IclR family transcriptional regulator, KDG regulon repressor